jgi:uncharacterized protein YlzI (FlbEa/FlbD family)
MRFLKLTARDGKTLLLNADAIESVHGAESEAVCDILTIDITGNKDTYRVKHSILAVMATLGGDHLVTPVSD